ncbi:MAG: bifunctional chorismate mutase/prephenate dehydratase, partial [Clostridia bacterium]|nr:bifunctional chorismate mutase/prephenate dehydratase [Clostridia bacterium]
FAHIAAKKIYGNAELVACTDFKAAYDAVANGECDVAVLPIENSTAGEVGSVLDLLFSGSLYITGVYDLFVHQHLMAKKGTSPDMIQRVVSHPQALAQCAPYLRDKGYVLQEFDNTAGAAKFVRESADPTIAASASEETAKLYGLEILARNINEQNINTTRFATVAKVRSEVPAERNRHSILMFTVSDNAGALSEAINVIGKYGFNMRCLRSRPMKDLMWKYYFYAEIEDNLDAEKGKSMLSELSGCCDVIKYFGSFNFPAELH